MDYLCNKYVPNSSTRRVILGPTSKTFINGLAASYDKSFSPYLKGYITENEYYYAMDRIECDLSSYWPCCFCFSYGYIFCLCTVGMYYLLLRKAFRSCFRMYA